MARAKAVLTGIGMHPLHVRAEIDAHIADRFLEAVWREALWLIKDGVATTEEIDDAIRYGFGLRWAQMGVFETYRIAGGLGYTNIIPILSKTSIEEYVVGHHIVAPGAEDHLLAAQQRSAIAAKVPALVHAAFRTKVAL